MSYFHLSCLARPGMADTSNQESPLDKASLLLKPVLRVSLASTIFLSSGHGHDHCRSVRCQMPPSSSSSCSPGTLPDCDHPLSRGGSHLFRPRQRPGLQSSPSSSPSRASSSSSSSYLLEYGIPTPTAPAPSPKNRANTLSTAAPKMDSG